MEAGEVGVTAMQQRVVMVTEQENEHVNLKLFIPRPKKNFFVNHRTKIISTSLVLLNSVQVSI
jgi:hypothetical protein